MRRNLHVLLFLIFSLFIANSFGQSVEIITPFRQIKMASVLALYKNQFGDWEKPDLDVTFPYAVIRMQLEGNEKSVKKAKQTITLYMGTQSAPLDRYAENSNELLFLVNIGKPFIYIDCGDGCERVLLIDNQRLQANSVYYCKVRYNLSNTEDNYLDTNEWWLAKNNFLSERNRLVINDSTDLYGFSISDNKKALFSPGNLQYQPSTKRWRFSEKQIDIFNISTYHVADNYNGWVDLFAWGRNYPFTSNKRKRFFQDWGNNVIGSYIANTWRTLTKDEWCYILHKRPNAYALQSIAWVGDNHILCLMLMPDNWICPSSINLDLSVGVTDAKISYFSFNELTSKEWRLLEQSGVIFLPIDDSTCYWTATNNDYNEESYILHYDDSAKLYIDSLNIDSVAYVRLVREK